MREKYFSLSYLGVTFMAFDVSIVVNGHKVLTQSMNWILDLFTLPFLNIHHHDNSAVNLRFGRRYATPWG